MIDHFLRCFRGVVLPILEYCSAVSGDQFINGGVFECDIANHRSVADIAHHRSVAVLCMLYKIISNPIHPRYDALPGPYVPFRDTRGALVRRLAAEPRRFPSQCQCHRFPSQCPSGTILLTPY